MKLTRGIPLLLLAFGVGSTLSSCLGGSRCDRPNYCVHATLHSCTDDDWEDEWTSARWTATRCPHGCEEPPGGHDAFCRPTRDHDPRCVAAGDARYVCDGQTLVTCWQGYAFHEEGCDATLPCDADAGRCGSPPPPPPRLVYCPQAGEAGYEDNYYTCADAQTRVLCIQSMSQNRTPCAGCYDRELGGEWFSCAP